VVRARVRVRWRFVRVPDDRRELAADPPAQGRPPQGPAVRVRIDTYGDTWGRFGLSFYIYALLFVAFDIEVIFIYLWALVFQDVLLGGLVSMAIFVAVLLLGLGYAWRKGVLTWK
jgi:hypothetical protein